MFAVAARHGPASRLVRLGVLLAMFVLSANPASAAPSGSADVVVTRDLLYGTDQGDQLLLDVYQPPAATSPSPIVILIHGGGWVSGDKAEYEPFSRSLAREGFLVFDINYSLDLNTSPAYPREVSDVQTALGWVRSHAAQFTGDAGRIAVAGGSAGAYLAAMLGTRPAEPNTAPLRAVISLSGPMDLMGLVSDLRQAVTSAPGQCTQAGCANVDLARVRLRGLLGCDPLQCPDALVRQASPMTHVTSSTPPFFLGNSTDEIIPATQATNMAATLRSRQVPVELHLVPGTGHAVAYVPAIAASLLAFLTKYEMSSAPAPTSAGTTTESQNGQQHGRFLRWIIVASTLFLLVVLYAVRRVTSRGARARRRDGAASSFDSRDQVDDHSPSGNRP